MAQEQYILTQCGTTAPTTSEIAAVSPLPTGYIQKFFTIPVQSIATTSSVQMTFFESLGLEQRVTLVSDSAVGACWQRAAGCGASLVSAWTNATLRAIQLESPDLEVVLMDCTSTSPTDCSNVNAASNGVHFGATQAGGPLASAEYVKFIAAFFNKDAEAQQIFDAQLVAYQSVATTISPAPVVAWISQGWGGGSLVLSQATYKLEMVTGAGGTNVNGDTVMAAIGSTMTVADAVPSNPAAGRTFTLSLSAYNGSLADASTAFFAALTGVDVVIDETYGADPAAYTMDTFYTNFGLTSSSTLPFIVNSMVIRYDGTLSSTGSSDWFETRVARPDYAVEGLRRCIEPDPNRPMRYFRNIATTPPEMPEVIAESECTRTLPQCDSTALADEILMMGLQTTGAAQGWGCGAVLVSATLALASLLRA
jgi:hypothetical protein